MLAHSVLFTRSAAPASLTSPLHGVSDRHQII